MLVTTYLISQIIEDNLDPSQRKVFPPSAFCHRIMVDIRHPNLLLPAGHELGRDLLYFLFLSSEQKVEENV